MKRQVALAGRKVTAEGGLLVDNREQPTQAQNREAARERLVALVRRTAIVPVGRTPTKVTRGQKQQRLATKKRRAEVKSARRRPFGKD